MKDHVRSNWRNVVLVCRKCSKKLDGGFGPDGDQRLAKALKKQLALKKGRKAMAGVIEVGCMGVCPKGAVTVIDGADSREWLLVQRGANLGELADTLGLGGAPKP